MANWQLIQRLQEFLGKAAPPARSPRELEQARELRRNGWAVASWQRQAPRPERAAPQPLGAPPAPAAKLPKPPKA